MTEKHIEPDEITVQEWVDNDDGSAYVRLHIPAPMLGAFASIGIIKVLTDRVEQELKAVEEIDVAIDADIAKRPVPSITIEDTSWASEYDNDDPSWGR